MRKGRFEKSVDVLKAFEKRDLDMRAMAATNLSFTYLLEYDVRSAEYYADLAYDHDRYDAKALVNKGNCLALHGKVDVAKQFYLEAIGVEAGCVEAMYNLSLANIRMGNQSDSFQALHKLHQIIPHSPEVVHQIAALHESRDEHRPALKWYNILVARVPSDPGVLQRLGLLSNCVEDKSHALHCHIESYRQHPVNLEVASWLGVWYVKSEMYNEAIHFFERASEVESSEVKWHLMISSCYRRMGSLYLALESYQSVHACYPQNVECLRYLIAICKDLKHPYEAYQARLASICTTITTETGIVSSNTKSMATHEVPHIRQDNTASCENSSGSHHKSHGSSIDTSNSGTALRMIESDDFNEADVQLLLKLV